MAIAPTAIFVSLLLQLAIAGCPFDPFDSTPPHEPIASPPAPEPTSLPPVSGPSPSPSAPEPTSLPPVPEATSSPPLVEPSPSPSLPEPTSSPPPVSGPTPSPSPPETTSSPPPVSGTSPPPSEPTSSPAPPPPTPSELYYKVIFDQGYVLTTAYSDHYKFIDVEYLNEFFMFKFAHKPHWQHDDYMIVQRNDKSWSEISFVFEHMPGHDCENSTKPVQSLIYQCVGDMMFRELDVGEKAKISKSKNVLAAIKDSETKLAYKVTYVEARLMIEQSGEIKQMKVEDNYNPGSMKIHAVVAPGKEAYVLLHDGQSFAKEKFVVESTPDPKTDCLKTPLEHLIGWCSGNLKVRQLTSDEAASFAL